jgi:sugar lactone lactonase YvrE
MKRWNTTGVCVILVLATLVLATGCKPPAPAAQPQDTIFYPEAPDPPRLQFLTQITKLEPNSAGAQSSFADFVVGATAEKGEEIRTPYGVAARDGKLYVCDLAVANVYILDIARNKYSLMGKSKVFKKPVNITIASDGTKYVCDTSLNKVAIFNAQDRFVRYIGNPTTCRPIDLAIWKDELVIADIQDNEVEVWSKDGKFLRKIATFGMGVTQLRMPTNLAIDARGRIFVSETMKGIIKMYNIKGQYLGSVGAQGDRPGFFARPKGLAIDPKGVLYVADSQWEIVQLFDPDGRLLMAFGGAKPGMDGMGMPSGVAMDSTSISAFKKYIDSDFNAEYLLFVSNQYGPNKIGVYAFGRSKTADYTAKRPLTATQPPAPKEPGGTPPKAAP